MTAPPALATRRPAAPPPGPAAAPGPAARRDRALIAALVVALIAGLAALVWSWQAGLILTYNDAASHLNIARRVLDSRTPGLAQLGTVWLPVPHVLLLPFVVVDPLWRTGLAGSVLGLACFVGTAAALWASIRLVTGRDAAAWAGLAVFVTNPNALYLQTTALTEPVLLLTMTGSAYFLLRWAQREGHRNLMAAGLLAALATGTRYDGWFFALAAAAAVFAVSYARARQPLRTEGLTLGFLTLPAYTMFMWFFYNALIFGDPLAFARGEYSAAFQQEAFSRAGLLPTKGNLIVAIGTYTWAVIDNLGPIVAATAGFGVAAYAFATRLRSSAWLPYVFLSPYIFNIIALYLGQTIILVPESQPPGYFNARYGLVVLPAAAFFTGYLADQLLRHHRRATVMWTIALLLIAQYVVWLPDWPASIITVTDGLKGLSAKQPPEQVSEYLRDRYDGGGILIDDSLHSPLMLRVGLDLREYIATFSGDLWRAALQDPTPYVRWVVLRPEDNSDRLQAALINNPRFQGSYRVAIQDQGYAVYRRQIDPAPAPGSDVQELGR